MSDLRCKNIYTKKKDIVKHTGTNPPMERYQADKANLSGYVLWDFKYVFTMVDHFTKYGWIVPLKDKKQKISWLRLKMSYYS